MSPCLVDECVEGVGVNWRPLIEFVVSVGYGVLSSVIPIFNSEIYIVASQVGGFTDEVTTAVGCAVGQPSARSASCWLSAGAVVPVRCNGFGSDASAPASRPVAFEPSSGPGRTGCWDSLVTTGGEYPLFSSPPASLFRRCTQ
jgi:hypothetical protein